MRLAARLRRTAAARGRHSTLGRVALPRRVAAPRGIATASIATSAATAAAAAARPAIRLQRTAAYLLAHMPARALSSAAAATSTAASSSASSSVPPSASSSSPSSSSSSSSSSDAAKAQRPHGTAPTHTHADGTVCDHDHSAENGAGAGECWRCKRAVSRGSFFCIASNCGMLQKPVSQNYFEIFQIDQKFDVDVRLLERRFKALQQLLHPDRFSTRSATEQTHSLSHAAIVNEAFGTLKDPLRRAKYLLEQQFGVSVSGEADTLTDPQLLMEILEIREAIEACAPRTASGAVAAASPQAMETLQALLQTNARDRAALVTDISAAFKASDVERVRAATIRLIYLSNIRDEILRRLPAA